MSPAASVEQLEADHLTMQRHVPDELDPEYCVVCVYEEYPCHGRMLARERLIEAGHLVPDGRPPRTGR